VSDYHLHLVPHDVPAEVVGPFGRLIERYVDHAREVGVTELGFTEHFYRCVESAPVLGPFWESEIRADLAAQAKAAVSADRTLSLETYVGAVLAAKEQGLPVKLGLEVDFFPETIDAVAAFLEPYPWDYLIGSVHWIGGWGVDDGRAAYEFERRGIQQAWDDYFDLELRLAESGLVDVLAHADVVKKNGHRPVAEPLEWYDRVAQAASRTGTAVEVSSQGLRYPAAEVYPSPAFLSRLADHDVGITLGSDGHTPDAAGWGHHQVVEAARDAGYSSYLRFEARRPEPIELPQR